jgi:hypothetical protein
MTAPYGVMPRRATKNLRPKRSTRLMEPKNARDKLFCERWLVHHDHHRAWREAGFAARSDKELPLAKLARFRPYFERLQPKVELQVAKKISLERQDILTAIANIGNANVLDYIVEVPNAATGLPEWRLKPLHQLTRDQGSAIDSVFWDAEQGRIGYTLPAAKTRLAALTTLGEQAADFKKKDDVHNHLHLGQDVPLDKIRQLKQLFIDAMGPQVTRELLGITEEEQAQ